MSKFIEKFNSRSFPARVAICLIAWLFLYFVLGMLSRIGFVNFPVYTIVSYWWAMPLILWFVFPKWIYKVVHAATSAFYDAKNNR